MPVENSCQNGIFILMMNKKRVEKRRKSCHKKCVIMYVKIKKLIYICCIILWLYVTFKTSTQDELKDNIID